MLRGALVAACLVSGAVVAPAAAAPAVPRAVVAVVGEEGVDVLHREYATADGRDVALPPAVAKTAVRVAVPRGGSYDARLRALRAGPLGRPRPDTLYYRRGTRLLVWTGTAGLDVLKGDMHGTGTTSLAAGRTVGTARTSLLVATLGHTHESWSWVASQPWIDVATTSVFEPVGGGGGTGLCDGAAGVAALAASGRLAFAAAGNGPVDTLGFSPGGHPALIRVGGVRPDGSTALPAAEGPTSYSAREYDVAELYRNKIAATGTDGGYAEAGGTSGSSPRLAGRVADLLARLRTAVGDTGTGNRGGGRLVVAARGRAPKSGPLADGFLTGEELRAA